MDESRPSIAYLTSGAGGMLCGSCLHDNTLARAMIRRGLDVQLLPTYTPIRTDEVDVSNSRVFLGGVNVFLSQSVPGYRLLPSFLTSWFDQPRLIRWATRRASATSPKMLGGLTVSMLRGTEGPQRREFEKLGDWLSTHVRPDLVVLSNMLIGGILPRLRTRLAVPLLVTLQGDDIFIDNLPEPYRSQSISEIHRLVHLVDGFLVNTRYYAHYMGQLLGIPPEKFHVVPLGIDIAGYPAPESGTTTDQARTPARPATIGYLARLAPEKGLHVLVDAFIELQRRRLIPDSQLRIAGWLGTNNHAYVEEQRAKISAAGLDSRVVWAGELDHTGKINFLRDLDVASVPTTYREPKGLYVLEALAAGVPVVQPDHGAFPELLAATGGGKLVAPNDPVQLAAAWESLLVDPPLRRQLGTTGQVAVHTRFHADAMAQATWDVMRTFIQTRAHSPVAALA